MTTPAALHRVHRAMVVIEARLFAPLTAPEIAAVVGGSESELHRLFRKVSGRSMMAYRRARRLTEAARMLQPPLSSRAPRVGLDDVARRCGYASQATFTRAFSRHFGVAPEASRRSGPRTLAWVEMPDLDVLLHRQGLPAPRLRWLHHPRVLHGVHSTLSMQSDADVLSTVEQLDTPAETELYGVLLSEVGQRMPYFLGAACPGAGPETLDLEPGLYAVVVHEGPREMVRHTVMHAVQTEGAHLLRPAQRRSFEVFRRGDLDATELRVELWLAVEPTPTPAAPATHPG